MATATAEQAFQLRVADWSNPRMVLSDGQSLALEVYRLSCACETCLARAEYVCAQLAGTPHRHAQVNGSALVVLPFPAGVSEDRQSIADYLGRVLGLAVQLVD